MTKVNLQQYIGLSMPDAEYRALDAENFTHIKMVGSSPLEYRMNLGFKSKSTEIGNIAHTGILEPDQWLERYAIYDGRRAGSDYEDFEEANQGKQIITIKDASTGSAMTRAVRMNPEANAQLTGGDAEVSFVWTDEPTGILCKGRADYVTESHVVDLKTTKSLAGFMRSLEHFKYHAQIAWYLDGITACLGGARGACIVAVESSPPYDVGVFDMTEDALEIGRARYRSWLNKIIECREADYWPGRYPGRTPIELSTKEYEFMNDPSIITPEDEKGLASDL